MAVARSMPLSGIVMSRKMVRILLSCVAASAALLVLADPDHRYVLAPLLAAVNIVVWMSIRLWDLDKVLPVFDVGFFCAIATLIYSIIPLLNFMAGGNEFTTLGDARLFRLHPTPFEVGSFVWRHVLYLCSLCIVYVWARGKGSISSTRIHMPDRASRQTIFVLFLLFTLYFLFIHALAGPVEGDSYGEMIRASAQPRLPLFVRQVNNYAQGMLFIFKLSLLFILISRCRSRGWLAVTGIWLLAEVALSLMRMGSRTGTALFLLATGLLYHRLVKPLQLKIAVPAALIFLTAFLAYGMARDVGVENIQGMRIQAEMFSVSNEFQALFGTSYDLLQMRESGLLMVPWQVRVNDIIQVLPPQQFLPFDKFDAASWYMKLIGDTESGSGYMWGVISQSIVGFDWIELAIRGALLGFIFARIHRWYVKRASMFFPNLLYIWLCLWGYYMFRDTTFSLLARLIYEVTPAFLLIQYTPKLLKSFGTTDSSRTANS